MSTTQDKTNLIEKIKKLMAKADISRGSTEAEAMTALKMAQELMTRHGIKEVEIEETDGKGHEFKFTQKVYKTGIPTYDFHVHVAHVVDKCCGVKIIHSRYFDNGKKRQAFYLVGESHDIEFAEIMIEAITSAMKSGIAFYLKMRGIKWTSAVANSYYNGLAFGYIEASETGRAQAMARESKDLVDRYAIVIADKKEKLKEWFESESGIQTKQLSVKARSHDPHAFVSGSRDGARLNVSPARNIQG